MRKLILLVALLIPSTALASSSLTFTGSARPTHSYTANFSTIAVGDLTVVMNVDKPSKATYYFNVRDLTHDVGPDPAIYCNATYSSSSVTCFIPNAPVADWEAYTFPTSGKLNLVITVTGELGP